MLHQQPVANYPFSQAALWQRCLDLFPSLDRDATRLLPLGVTAARIKKFKEDTDLFGQMDPDSVLVQEGAVATGQKTAEHDALVTSIQQVMARIGLKEDPRTAAYKRFGAASVSNATEAELHLAGVLVVKQGRKYLTDYAAVGLTKELLDAVESTNARFVDELTTSKETDNERQAATDARIVAANALFAELTGICAAGNASWRFESQTQADEYVVDHAPVAGTPPAAKPIA
ncbi:MAG: hypothetical protein M3Y54_05120 [Bacteroidota bacterium]|nr:hypothetical protein [Bacteroidota bacterium]